MRACVRIGVVSAGIVQASYRIVKGSYRGAYRIMQRSYMDHRVIIQGSCRVGSHVYDLLERAIQVGRVAKM